MRYALGVVLYQLRDNDRPMMAWEQIGIAVFALAILCEQAHVASPIVLAWSHPGLRQIALSRPIETMVLPVVAIIGALASPFWLIWWIYWLWNIYHFGAQHYGVLQLYRRRVSGQRLVYSIPNRHLRAGRISRNRRRLNMGFCVGGTAAIMVGLPWLVPAGWVRWFLLIAIDFNHWLVDISLSSRVSRHWQLFLASVLLLGCIGFAWKVPRSDHIATMFVPWIIQARWGVGIAHFLYSRWVWKLSDPQVRATIGRDLLQEAPR